MAGTGGAEAAADGRRHGSTAGWPTSPANQPADPPARALPLAGRQVAKLKEHAKPVTGSGDIKNVAAISAGNDEEIGQMIADALDKVGADGVLAIESSNSLETTVRQGGGAGRGEAGRGGAGWMSRVGRGGAAGRGGPGGEGGWADGQRWAGKLACVP